MVNLIIHWVLNGLALFIVSRILPGIVVKDFGTALIAALVIGLVNALVRPVLLLLTLPINILTLGLFTFVLNALMLLLAGSITPGFAVDGFWTALIGSILLSLVATILHPSSYKVK
ncbi:phage holin family protein [Candidatus Gottesmanbacteria bacterium]|nr:phage holin family protein [Candidatus Gottesmanbacteria bacterium]